MVFPTRKRDFRFLSSADALWYWQPDTILRWTGGRFYTVGGRFSQSINVENVVFAEMISKEQQWAVMCLKLCSSESMKHNLSNKETFTGKAFRSSENEPFWCSMFFALFWLFWLFCCPRILTTKTAKTAQESCYTKMARSRSSKKLFQ